MAPYSPTNGEVRYGRLWGVQPTHYDPENNMKFAQKDGKWYQMEFSGANSRYIGLETKNADVIKRLAKLAQDRR